MSITKHGGAPFTMANGEELVVPPLPFGPMQQILEKAETTTLTWRDNLNLMAEAVFVALRRNYPDLTQERLNDEMLDSSNLRKLYALVMNASGAMDKAVGEAERAREAQRAGTSGAPG
jgi:hypothetical protein